MEDMLKRLLEAEQQAEALVKEADAERERTVHQAEAEARELEENFTQRIPEIRAVFLQKAEEQAAQTLKDLRRHYDELAAQLDAQAEQREPEAVQAAVDLLLDPTR